MTTRVVATDLDGTIVRSDGEISTRTRTALTRVESGGGMVVIVTGRPPRWLHVGGAPRLRADCAQKGCGVRSAGTDLHVVWL